MNQGRGSRGTTLVCLTITSQALLAEVCSASVFLRFGFRIYLGGLTRWQDSVIVSSRLAQSVLDLVQALFLPFSAVI